MVELREFGAEVELTSRGEVIGLEARGAAVESTSQGQPWDCKARELDGASRECRAEELSGTSGKQTK